MGMAIAGRGHDQGPPWGARLRVPTPPNRGKLGVKRSLLTEGKGIPIGIAVAGANRHDMKLVPATLESMAIDRPEPSREQPQNICLDKGYDYPQIEELVDRWGYTAPYSKPGRREAGAGGDTGLPGPALGSGTHPQLAEPLSAHLGSLGKGCGQLSGNAAFNLPLDCFSGCRSYRIGS